MKDEALLRKQFSSLPALCVYAKDGCFLIPPNLLEIDEVVALLSEISYSYKEDIEENQYLLDDFPPSNIEEFEAFRRREIWRIGSFIVFALNLESILRQEYKSLFGLVKKLEPNNPTAFSEMVERREQEVVDYRYYRNKIFAHTAFGKPRREDNLSMRSTSLAYLTGLGSITSDGIGLGGVSVVVGQEAPPEFQQLTFAKMMSDLGQHFQKWHQMYKDLCEVINNSTDHDIEKCFQDVVFIQRLGGSVAFPSGRNAPSPKPRAK